MCAIVGVFLHWAESVIVLHRDLNTKQSYMLFLTPKSSYPDPWCQGPENGISIALTGVFLPHWQPLMTLATFTSAE